MTGSPFDPNTAPKAGNTGQDRAAMRADMNKVALKLHEAGIQLYGFYKIHDLVPYWNPLGFDFMCDNWRQLLDAAGKAPRLGSDQIDMPGYDPWLKAGVKSVGFTQTGKAPHVHLDIAIDRPALCRIYILEKDDERRLDALRRARVVTARDTEVFRKIYRRVEGLGVDLDEHIGSHLEAGRLVLDGINFVAKDHNRLLDVLTNLKYPAGNSVFFRGERSGRGHFFGNASFLATEGIGFRQIWQTFPEERPVATTDPRTGPAIDPKASARFGDLKNLPDLTSVHCARLEADLQLSHRRDGLCGQGQQRYRHRRPGRAAAYFCRTALEN